MDDLKLPNCSSFVLVIKISSTRAIKYNYTVLNWQRMDDLKLSNCSSFVLVIKISSTRAIKYNYTVLNGQRMDDLKITVKDFKGGMVVLNDPGHFW